MYKNILVPTDGSNLSARALTQAVVLANALDARITGFYAAPNYSVQVYGDFVPSDFITPQEFATQTRRTAEKFLSVIERTAAAAGVRCKTVHALNDTPWKAIIKAAHDNKCDLIFMASHGRRGLAGLLLGSETTKVLTHTKIPVLVHR
jgi:nucleotide-binding universal stress UspA family protein